MIREVRRCQQEEKDAVPGEAVEKQHVDGPPGLAQSDSHAVHNEDEERSAGQDDAATTSQVAAPVPVPNAMASHERREQPVSCLSNNRQPVI